MVGSGLHINAIGGDCPGKTEIHKDILLRSEIFVEYSPQTRIEGEIQQLEAEHPVTELWQVMTGIANGRKDDRQITLFDSVGFATEDFSSLRYVYDRLNETGNYQELDMIADPDQIKQYSSFNERCTYNPTNGNNIYEKQKDKWRKRIKQENQIKMGNKYKKPNCNSSKDIKRVITDSNGDKARIKFLTEKGRSKKYLGLVVR